MRTRRFRAQLLVVYNALKEKPMTMMDLAVETGIMRANICRHIAKLESQWKIAIIRKRRCIITGEMVNEYTANPELFPKSNQLKLF